MRLGSICDYGSCQSVHAANIHDDAWVLDLEDIEKYTSNILQYTSKKERKFLSTKHMFKKGQVLYSKLRIYLNKVIVAPKDGYCTSEILPLTFYIDIHPEYVRIFLMSHTFLSYANQCSYGVKMPRLGTIAGKMALFALPPLQEQIYIVNTVLKSYQQLDNIYENIK